MCCWFQQLSSNQPKMISKDFFSEHCASLDRFPWWPNFPAGVFAAHPPSATSLPAEKKGHDEAEHSNNEDRRQKASRGCCCHKALCIVLSFKTAMLHALTSAKSASVIITLLVNVNTSSLPPILEKTNKNLWDVGTAVLCNWNQSLRKKKQVLGLHSPVPTHAPSNYEQGSAVNHVVLLHFYSAKITHGACIVRAQIQCVFSHIFFILCDYRIESQLLTFIAQSRNPNSISATLGMDLTILLKFQSHF